DWCLSRQRYWGVPIPALVCNNCKEEVLEPEAIRKLARFSAAEGSDAWFSRGVKEFVPQGLKCPHCSGTEFSKGSDILDVWFDSGASHQAVLKKRGCLEFPAALYLEGSDQHRGWFQTSLITSIGIESVAPFKAVLTHGFVVDGEGRKMSKSAGNVISPLDIIKNSGADILRLWAASSDYNEDIRISTVILSRLSEAYRKIRNTLRFMLSNLNDFDPVKDKVDPAQMRKIDKWILTQANELLVEKCAKAYGSFEFYKAYQMIYDFCNSELSSLYLDMVKGRLYTFGKNSVERRGAQTAAYEVMNMLVRVMAPILSFTAEETWQFMQGPCANKKFSSVHLLAWPKKFSGELEADSLQIKQVFEIMPQVTKALEEKRAEGVIGSSFDAKINILTNNQIRYNTLYSLKADLCEIFKVSQVLITKSDNQLDCSVEVFPAEGKKCQRCWNYVMTVGANSEHPEICDNCISAIGGKT
ncbi:MAG: class I tRNA ligase family protein, partial [Candidatus Omnitrophica bacterium]|nr:class I tRNA ligase family protein [Candidatus Omnitrophota bacterium]